MTARCIRASPFRPGRLFLAAPPAAAAADDLLVLLLVSEVWGAFEPGEAVLERDGAPL